MTARKEPKGSKRLTKRRKCQHQTTTTTTTTRASQQTSRICRLIDTDREQTDPLFFLFSSSFGFGVKLR
jgi:hypothetical protein